MTHIEHFPVPVKGEYAGEKQLGEEPFIHPSCYIRNSEVGAWTALGANTTLVDSCFGDYSYTAGDVQVIYATVGKYCSIASHACINPGNHPQWRVTQHHMTYRRQQYGLGAADDAMFFEWRRDHACVIGHDVWIGHGAIILPGVNVGTGAVVGAGAVVSRDIGPYEVAVGVPARIIKKRFPDSAIESLLESAWWDWDRATLEERFGDLLDLETFLHKYNTTNV